MLSYARNMHQVATYWAPGVNNGFGKLDFAGIIPVLINCRWQDDAVLFRNAQGQEETSSAIVYPDRELMIEGYLARGDHTETGTPTGPLGVAGAHEIRQVGQSPSLTADEVLYKVYL